MIIIVIIIINPPAPSGLQGCETTLSKLPYPPPTSPQPAHKPPPEPRDTPRYVPPGIPRPSKSSNLSNRQPPSTNPHPTNFQTASKHHFQLPPDPPNLEKQLFFSCVFVYISYIRLFPHLSSNKPQISHFRAQLASRMDPTGSK